MLAELLAEPGVDEVSVLDGRVGVMALHGGIEAATAEAAAVIADNSGASLYVVAQPDDLRWHVPSTHFDPGESARLDSFLAHVAIAVSLHGFSRPGMERAVLLGGSNRGFADRTRVVLAARTRLVIIADLQTIPAALRGVHPRNPVNLPRCGGVQVELSPEAREPAVWDALVDALTEAVAAEMDRPVASTVG